MVQEKETRQTVEAKNKPFGVSCLAAGQGFEPRLMVPKTTVLPLDDPALCEPRGIRTPNHVLKRHFLCR